MPQPQRVPNDAIAQAHRSRHGRTRTPPEERHTSLADRDIQTVLNEDFLPPADLIDQRINFPGIDELREEHARHTAQNQVAAERLFNLNAQFKAEDQEHENALWVAYAEGTPTDKLKDKRTPQDTRQQQLADAELAVRQAHSAAHEWASDAMDDLRDPSNTFAWSAAIAEAQAGTRSRIEELNVELDELKHRLQRDQHLETWVKRFTAPTPGMLMPYGRLAAVRAPEEPTTLGPYGEVARRQALAARGLPVT